MVFFFTRLGISSIAVKSFSQYFKIIKDIILLMWEQWYGSVGKNTCFTSIRTRVQIPSTYIITGHVEHSCNPRAVQCQYRRINDTCQPSSRFAERLSQGNKAESYRALNVLIWPPYLYTQGHTHAYTCTHIFIQYTLHSHFIFTVPLNLGESQLRSHHTGHPGSKCHKRILNKISHLDKPRLIV